MRHLIVILILLTCSYSFAAEKKGVRPKGPILLSAFSEDQIARILERGQSLPFDERLAYFSSLFAGTPYKVDALGEGEGSGEDTDPRFRLDAVDCVTFLETLLAMQQSQTLEQWKEQLLAIRYSDRPPAYACRRHLSWFQWIPDFVEMGYLTDVTQQVSGESALNEKKTFSPKYSCGGKWKEFCEKLGDRLPDGTVTHRILPLDWAIKNQSRIPSGVFAFIVHEDRAWLPYRIRHAGLILKDHKGRLMFRHASKVHKKVVDVPLSRYLEMLKTKTVNWPVTGLILLRPVERIIGCAGDQPKNSPAPAKANQRIDSER